MTGQAAAKGRLRIGVPSAFLTLMTLANLAALWFAVYKILPLTLMAMAAVLFAVFRPVAPVSLRRIAPAVFALVSVYVYTGVATTWSPNPGAALGEFTVVVLAIVPAVLFGYFLGSRFNVLEVALGFGVLPLIFLLQAVFNQFAMGDAMLIGEFSIRSLLGGVTCLTTPLLLAACLQRPRLFIGLQFLLSLLLALMIQSRSSVLIVSPAILYVLFRYSRKAFFSAMLVGAMCLVMASAVNVGQIAGRFSTENTSLDITDAVLEEAAKPVEDRVDFDRRLAAFVSTNLFLQNPLRGGGYSSVLQTNEGEYGLEIVSHGFVPGTAGELGLFGLTFILFFFHQLYRLNRPAHSPTGSTPQPISIGLTGFWCGLTALVFYGFFHQTFESAIFGVTVGIAFGLMATAGHDTKAAFEDKKS